VQDVKITEGAVKQKAQTMATKGRQTLEIRGGKRRVNVYMP